MTTLSVIARKDGRGLVDGPFGSNLPASEYVPVGIPVIRGVNLSLGDVRFKDNEFVCVSDETAKRLERSLCSFEDVIFTKKGTLGQIGIIPRTHRYKKFLISSNQMKLSVDRDIADPLFVYYYLSSAASRKKIIQDSEATGVPKTNLTYLRTFPILLPPLPEQKAIAHILGTLDDKIELNREMNQTLEAMARAIFKSWFVDFDPVRAKMEGRSGTTPAFTHAIVQVSIPLM
ncbi:MAG: restriction endonuclease subunit S [Nostoc sp.]